MTLKTAPEPIVAPHGGLLDWLAGHGVEYELRVHPRAFTAIETAEDEGIDPRRFAKTIVVEDDEERRAIVVVDALDRIQLSKVARAMHAEHARLLDEHELTLFAPNMELGAIPPIGDLFGVRVYADYTIYEAPEITFPAGSHAYTVTVDRAVWSRAAKVAFVDIMDDDDRPAWLAR